MATVTGLTAARMQEIIDKQIDHGAIDLSGHLIFTREDGSTFDAGVAKGAKGDPAVYSLPGFPLGTTPTYVRLLTLDGTSATAGAHAQFDLAGLGDYGTMRRGSVRVDVVQRGTDGIHLRAWGLGTDQSSANSVKLYTRRLGAFLFEVWALFTTYTSKPTYSDISLWKGVLNLDSNTSVAPSDLVEWPVTVVGAVATGAEIQDGTDNAKVATAKALADAGGATPVGTVSMFAGATAPAGHLLCRGQAVSRTTYARLFAIIGTTYGAGNGTTTFNVPNLQGRVPVGMNSAETEFDALGETGGAKTHTLTEAQMPDHDHDFFGQTITWGSGNIGFSTQPQAYAGAPSGNGLGTYQDMDGWAWTLNRGGGQAHNNLQPYIALNFIIKF